MSELFDTKKIKYMFSVVSGATPDSKNPDFWDGDIDWITPSDYKTCDKVITRSARKLSVEGYKSCGTTIVPQNSIIISKRAPIGTVALSGIPLCTNQGCLSLVPIDKDIPEFYYFALSVSKEKLESLGEGTTFQEMSAAKFANMRMIHPVKEEQMKIVEYLNGKCSNIDEAISLHNSIIDKLEEYKRACIVAGVSGGFIKGEMKDSGIKWMQSVPSDWNVIPLWVLFNERKHKNSLALETNLLSLSYGNIKRKDIETKEGLLPENFNGYNIIEEGDIVLRLTDLQNDMKSLRTGLVKEHGIITSAYVTLKPIAEVNSAYYHYLLHAYDVMKVFYSMGEGIRQNLNYDELSRMLVPQPSLPQQAEIVAYLDEKCAKVNEAIARQEEAITKLEEYRKSVIYNAVTGKIDCQKGA